MIRQSPMAGGFIDRTISNTHVRTSTSINSYWPDVDSVWIKNINKVEDNTNVLLSYILCILVSRFGERLKYSSSDPPLFQTFYEFILQVISSIYLLPFRVQSLYFSLFPWYAIRSNTFHFSDWLVTIFSFFFSHFPLLSLCKACRRTQSFLGQFLGHINYL